MSQPPFAVREPGGLWVAGRAHPEFSTRGMKIEIGELLTYRNYVLSIPRLHIWGGGRRQSFEAGIVYEVTGGRIQRSFGYGNVGAAVKKLGSLLHAEHELAV